MAPFVAPNKFGDESINFFDPKAVKMLNTALLKHYYGIDHWDIPEGYLCPPIPGRADYIHYIADLLYSEVSDLTGANAIRTHQLRTDIGKKIKCLDIGVGANCVYPIIGHQTYAWSFIGSEIDPIAVDNAKRVIQTNSTLAGKVDIRLQTKPKAIFKGIIQPNEYFDITICNPPFHASAEEAQKGNIRKLENLQKKKITETALNFGGINYELWVDGGEKKFLINMINESKEFASSCLWFTSLISKESNLKVAIKSLEKAKAYKSIVIPMSQGHKTSRIIAWTFMDEQKHKSWIHQKWMES